MTIHVQISILTTKYPIRIQIKIVYNFLSKNFADIVKCNGGRYTLKVNERQELSCTTVNPPIRPPRKKPYK